jgi:hypothetical protein
MLQLTHLKIIDTFVIKVSHKIKKVKNVYGVTVCEMKDASDTNRYSYIMIIINHDLQHISKST